MTNESMVAAPSGRVTFTGAIVFVKVSESTYGTEFKMLVVADDNYKVWSTVPKSIVFETLKGRRVAMTATLTPSAKDPTFAIAKRPVVKLIDDPAVDAPPRAEE